MLTPRRLRSRERPRLSTRPSFAALAPVGETVIFVLERPAPSLPPHGWARKNLRCEPQSRFTVEQKGFLDMHFASSLKGERMRDKKVCN